MFHLVNHTVWILTLLISALFLSFLVLYFYIIKPFAEDKAYIKIELGRADNKNELRYWNLELKKLYLSHVPFIGGLLSRKIKP